MAVPPRVQGVCGVCLCVCVCACVCVRASEECISWYTSVYMVGVVVYYGLKQNVNVALL